MTNSTLPNTRPSTRSSTLRRRSALAALAGAAALSIALLTGCTGSAASDTSGSTVSSGTAAGATDRKVLFLGDSIAGSEAPALKAAIETAGATFQSDTLNGGGGIVETGDGMTDDMIKEDWPRQQKSIAEAKANTVLWQITIYDWGTPEQQKKAIQKLADEAGKAGSRLVIVSTPPVDDSFYTEHASETATINASAKSIADASGGKVVFLDSSPLWGTDPAAEKALRSEDGEHNCQQGAAAFAKWFTTEYAALPGGVPASPVDSWATGSWTSDPVFAKFKCPAAGA